jgi:hypothetical protein
VTDGPALLASDADRDRTIMVLREHTAVGRLTLEEFIDRMSTASLARTQADLEELTRDLPAVQAPIASRRARTRFLVAIFGSTERDGRIRVGRRIACLLGFGNIDLDLRQASTEQDVVTIFAFGIFGAIDVFVPEGVEVDLHGLVVFGHKGSRGNEPPPHLGTPLDRLYTLSLFAGIDVWRVPLAWTQKSWREVIRGIRAGDHTELEA